jgi:hypothetical protein
MRSRPSAAGRLARESLAPVPEGRRDTDVEDATRVDVFVRRDETLDQRGEPLCDAMLGRRANPVGVVVGVHNRQVVHRAGDIRKPDGDLFENTAQNAIFINEAARYARWLGYVPFERISDNKNDEPVVRKAPTSDDPTVDVWADDLDIADLDADVLGVSAGLADFEPRQPYRLVFFGEKTSLEDVLGPLAEEVSADLYLTGGQISDTLLHRMASDAVSDGRPLVMFTFSDFDPSGYWDMPNAIARCRRCAISCSRS